MQNMKFKMETNIIKIIIDKKYYNKIFKGFVTFFKIADV